MQTCCLLDNAVCPVLTAVRVGVGDQEAVPHDITTAGTITAAGNLPLTAPTPSCWIPRPYEAAVCGLTSQSTQQRLLQACAGTSLL